MIRAAVRALLSAAIGCLAPASAMAGDRFALVVTGATGGPEYAAKYESWRESLVGVLKEKFGYPDDHIKVLSEEGTGSDKATASNVRAAFADLRKRLVDGDVTLVLLIGHGTSDSDEAKFNLVGPDLTVDEWAALVKPLPGRVAFVDTASGSFPYLAALAGKNRVILTANDSAQQQFETSFPGFFVKAFSDDAADSDKNGKVSLFEAFTYASMQVKEGFVQKGQLATERALIDDTGAGVGRDIDTPGKDGQLAQITYLQPDVPPALAGNPELASLMRRRAEVEDRLNLLKAGKAGMPADRYEEELERLLLELARIDRQLRAKT